MWRLERPLLKERKGRRVQCSISHLHEPRQGKYSTVGCVLVTRDFWPGDASPNLSICCMLRSLSLGGEGSRRRSQPQARGGDDDTDGVVRVGLEYGTGLSVNGRKVRKVVCFTLPYLGWHLNMRDDAQLHRRGRAKSE
jgi:hypothetical protein